MESSLTDSSFIVKMFRALPQYASGSKVLLFLYKIFSFLASALKGCWLGRLLTKAGDIKLDRDNSVFYRITDNVVKSVLYACRKIYSFAQSGIVYKTAVFFFKESVFFKVENMLPLIIFVMFLCPHEMWNNAYALLFAIMLLFMYLVAVLRKRNFGTSVTRIPLTVILFMVSALVSVAISHTRSDSVRVFMFFVTSFMFFVITLAVSNTQKRFDKISFALYAAVFASALVAFYQKARGIEVDPSLTDATLNAGMPGRAFSTLANPNNYAQFLIIFMPFCAAFALTRESKWHKAALTCLLVIPFVALLITYSRSGWLGFMVATLVFISLYNKKFLPILLAIAICIIPFLPESIMNRILTIGNMKDSSNHYRICIWTGVLLMMRDFWFTGTGLGPEAFRRLYMIYTSEYARPAPHTHMLFMEVFAEMGVLGVIVFFALIVSLIFVSCRQVNKFERKSIPRMYVIAAASSVAGILMIGFAEYVWFYPRVMFAFFIALGLAASAQRIKE